MRRRWSGRLTREEWRAGGDEDLGVERLGDKVVAPGGEALLAVAGLGGAGEGDDRSLETAGAQGADGLEAADAGHLHVEQDEVELELGGGGSHGGAADEALEGLGAVVGDDDLGARAAEVEIDEFEAVGRVVDDEDASGEAVGERVTVGIARAHRVLQ